MTLLLTVLACVVGLLVLVAAAVVCLANDIARHGHDWRRA